MNSTLNAQSMADLGRTLPETIDRLDQTNQAELITVDGQPRAVLLSLAAYQGLTQGSLADELHAELGDELTDEDVAQMRESIRQADAGLVMTVDEAFAPIHAELLDMQRAEHARQVL